MDMKGKGKDWLLAIAMGILLPSLLFTIAEEIISRKQPDSPGISTTETTIQNTEKPPTGTADTITVLLNDGTIRQMDLDTYLTGVLLGELPTDFELETLKAQAVVARTYALKRYTTGKKHESGAVCTTSSCCQAYKAPEVFLANGGTQAALDRVSSAVLSTSGEVITYDGALIEATYFSCSGGRTEDALAVWGTDIPYLQAVDSPGEEQATHYKDIVQFSAKEFAERLGIRAQGSPSSWLGQITYTDGGGVDTIVIAGNVFKGTSMRQKLGLRSTAFVIMAVGDNIHIATRGFGHRVGMSQYGAEAMAVKGSTYREILSHYYPGTDLKTYSPN